MKRSFSSVRLILAMVVSLTLVGSVFKPAVAGEASAFDKGVEAYKARQYAKAAKLLVECVKLPGKEAASYYYLAGCYYSLNRPAEARSLYSTVVKNFPTSQEARLASQMLARFDPVAHASGQPTQALAVMQGARTNSSPGASSSLTAKPSAFPGEDFSKLPNEARIPFTEDSNGHMRVTVYVNDRPIQAIFDTGANGMFGKNHFAAASIPMPAGEPNSYAAGWSGNKVPAWRYPARLRMGNMTRLAPICVEENMDLQPLVGQEFIQGYQCEIDNGSHYIILRKASAFQASSSQVSDLYDVPCVRRDMRDFCNVTINGKKLEVLIDTGAVGSIFSEDDLNKIGIRVPEDAQVRTMQGVGGSFACKIFYAELRLGPIWKKDYPVCVGGAAGSAVGQDILSTQRFTIDREKNLMRFFH